MSKTSGAPQLGTNSDTINEQTPLLGEPTGIQDDQDGIDSVNKADAKDPSQDNETTVNEEEDDDKPLPYAQVMLLCCCALAEPVAYFGIFPFINEMIHRLGEVPKTEVGYYSGLIESLFSVVQMMLMVIYGRLSDRLGRKPVLVFSLVGMGTSMALFGMSQSLWQMILLRCMAGVFAGSSVTIRTMIGENSTKRTQGTTFSWFMFVRNMGILIGPPIGGGFANPAETFPRIFDTPFWRKYPYALSTYCCAAFTFVAVILTILFVKETLQRKTESGPNAKPPMSTWEVLTAPGVPMVLYIYGNLNFLALAYTAVQPVFMYLPVREGGLGFTNQQIALFLVIVGASQSIWQLLVFPPLQRRIGTGTILRWCAVFFTVFMTMYPILNEFLRQGWTTLFWVVSMFTLILGSGVAMAFACVQLLVNDIRPSTQVLGTLNALALTINSAVRSIAPIVGTSILSKGAEWGWAHGHLGWIFLDVVGIVLIIAVQFIPPAAEGKPLPKDPPRQRSTGQSEQGTERVS